MHNEVVEENCSNVVAGDKKLKVLQMLCGVGVDKYIVNLCSFV